MTPVPLRPNRHDAARIVRDAGGEIIGQTRLQKVAYLLELAGLGSGFRFAYRHYGPYSEDLASAVEEARAFGLVSETERLTTWGGAYSVYRYTADAGDPCDGRRTALARVAAQLEPTELELVATAAYLRAVERSPASWDETRRLKSERAAGFLESARRAYEVLRGFPVPKPLPALEPDAQRP